MPTNPELKREDILFLFIDLQVKLLNEIVDHERVLSRSRLLIQGAKLLGCPYLATTQYSKGLGELHPSIGELVPPEIPDKTTFSCLGCGEVQEWLERYPRPVAVLAGVETHICVLQTALDLLRRGRQVILIADAISARGGEDHRWGLHRAEQEGARIYTAEMLLYELVKSSSSSEFKSLLPLLKKKLPVVTGFMGQ